MRKLMMTLLIFGSLGAQAFEPNLTACESEGYIRQNGCARDANQDHHCGSKTRFAFVKDSCWENKIPELPVNHAEVLNVTPEILRNYGVNAVAEQLILRHYTLNELPKIKNRAFKTPAYSLYSGIEGHLLFPDSILERVQEKGFLNQHHTQTSHGVLNDQMRWTVEEGFLKVKFDHDDDLSKHLAPKYLFAIPMEKISKGRDFAQYQAYGNVVAVLSPQVKKRMTITGTDSLDMYRYEKKKIMNTLKWVSKKTNYDIDGYLEAQVWGTLTLTDVEYLLVNCPGLQAVSQERIEVLAQLSGLKVYSCDQVEMPSSQRFIKRSQL